MLKAYKLMNGIDDRNFGFLYNTKTIYPKNETKINEIFLNFSLLTCYEKNQIKSGFIIIGKKIIAKGVIDGKNIEIEFGTLNSTEELFKLINEYKENINKISINNNIIIKKNQIKSLFDLGIKEDFVFAIKSNAK